jgi:hypothetical protein
MPPCPASPSLVQAASMDWERKQPTAKPGQENIPVGN